MRPLLTVNCVLFLDLQCIQRSRLASAGNNKINMEIIASLDVPPPYRSSMQRTANKVGNATATMTLADLAKRRDHMNKI